MTCLLIVNWRLTITLHSSQFRPITVVKNIRIYILGGTNFHLNALILGDAFTRQVAINVSNAMTAIVISQGNNSSSTVRASIGNRIIDPIGIQSIFPLKSLATHSMIETTVC